MKRYPTVVAAGAGYVLSRFAEFAAEREIVLVGRSSDQRSAGSSVRCVSLDAGDYRGLLEIFKQLKPPLVLIDSVPPGKDGSVEANLNLSRLAKEGSFERAIYLSATSVYNGRGGVWVDESSPTEPTTPKGQARLRAEECYRACGVPSVVLRLSGIYGPGRSVADRLRRGSGEPSDAERYTNRIHVDDIVAVLERLIYDPPPLSNFEILNVSDDLPALKGEVTEYYTKKFSLPVRRVERAETNAASSSEQNQRVSNKKLKTILAPFSLKYPDYRAGAEAGF
ncbi:MAG: hypothetical protein DCC75_06630 [Proteobacteria bacterium]|nr:MAG: hypothetical protein DCC75_06630 [Pseudomonadota bacterium]